MEFFNNLYTVFVQVIILAVIAAVGFFGDRVGFFTEKASRLCNDLLFYVVTPCVIVNSFASTQFSKETAAGYFSAIGCFFFSFSVAIAVSFLLFRKGNRDENAVYRYSVVYGNNGYMGLPLSAAVMAAVRGSGDIGIFYCSAAVVVFNIFCFTHGVWLMSGGGRLDLKKLIINPGTLSVLVGLPIFFFNIKLPAIIATPITHIGNMNTRSP